MCSLDTFIAAYLAHKPFFYSLIRPQEAFLFCQHQQFLHSPLLDFGSGDGFFTSLILPPHVQTWALDINPQVLAKARSRHLYHQVVFVQKSKLPFANHTFAAIISNCVLEHIPNLTATLHELHRVLQPKGHFLTTVMTNNWNRQLMGTKLFGHFYQKFMAHQQKHYQLLTLHQWQHAFAEAGFQIRKVTGYLSSNNGRLLDLAHYLSSPSLLSHLIAKKWVPFPQLQNNNLVKNWVRRHISLSVPPTESGALFFLLQKK